VLESARVCVLRKAAAKDASPLQFVFPVPEGGHRLFTPERNPGRALTARGFPFCTNLATRPRDSDLPVLSLCFPSSSRITFVVLISCFFFWV
jgi:hypothetical protein